MINNSFVWGQLYCTTDKNVNKIFCPGREAMVIIVAPPFYTTIFFCCPSRSISWHSRKKSGFRNTVFCPNYISILNIVASHSCTEYLWGTLIALYQAIHQAHFMNWQKASPLASGDGGKTGSSNNGTFQKTVRHLKINDL